MLTIILTGIIVTIFFGILLKYFFTKRKQHNIFYKEIFSTVYSPIIIKAQHIKKTYGFFENQPYVIREHRIKQSNKVTDSICLADEIMKQLEGNEQYMSKKMLELYFGIHSKNKEYHELETSNLNASHKDFLLAKLEYEINTQKLILMNAFFKEMEQTAENADLLYPELKDMFQFYSHFTNHILLNELILALPTSTSKKGVSIHN